MAKKREDGRAAGGVARAKALSPERRSDIAKKAAMARWTEAPLTATHEGILQIGSLELPVAVLNDGRRMLTAGAMLTALGRPWKGSYRRTELPSFLDANNLKAFITPELRGVLQAIEFRGSKGQLTGYRAELLPLVCDVYLQAREAGKVRGRQAAIAKQAEILVRSLSRVGITALVDEATGYQSIRPQDALQQYLQLLIREELAAWVKKFPDEFYENIYKLKGWSWPGMGKNRYSVVAHYTRDLVYERMAPGLLEELERKSPKNDSGHRDVLMQRWLSEDIGDPMLAQHLHSLIMFQRLAIANGYGWKRFINMVDQVLPKKEASRFLPFIDPDPSI